MRDPHIQRLKDNTKKRVEESIEAAIQRLRILCEEADRKLTAMKEDKTSPGETLQSILSSLRKGEHDAVMSLESSVSAINDYLKVLEDATENSVSPTTIEDTSPPNPVKSLSTDDISTEQPSKRTRKSRKT